MFLTQTYKTNVETNDKNKYKKKTVILSTAIWRYMRKQTYSYTHSWPRH